MSNLVNKTKEITCNFKNALNGKSKIKMPKSSKKPMLKLSFFILSHPRFRSCSQFTMNFNTKLVFFH